MNLSLVHLIYKLWTDIDKWLYVVSIVDNIAQRNNKTIKSKNLKNKKSWLHPSLGHGWLVQNLWTLHVKWSHHHLCQSRPSSKCFKGITNLLWRDLAITIGIKKLENAFPIGYILWIIISHCRMFVLYTYKNEFLLVLVLLSKMEIERLKAYELGF